MKNNNNRSFAGIAVATLTAMSIATTVASCGGGGDDVALGPPLPPEQALLDINAGNAVDVSSTVINAINTSFGFGDVIGDFTGIQAASVLATDEAFGALITRPLMSDAFGIQDCDFGGTVEIRGDVAPAITAGDTIIAIFNSCDDGDGFVISGEVDIAIVLIEGTFLTPYFRLDLDVALTDIEIIEGADIAFAEGDFRLLLDSLDWPRVAQVIEGAELEFGVNIDRIALTDFRHEVRLSGSVSPVGVIVTAEGQMDSTELGGAVEYQTPWSFQAWDGFDPFFGEMLIIGNRDSSVRIIVNDINSITLEVDGSGNGVIDAYIDATWSDLIDTLVPSAAEAGVTPVE